MGEALQSMGIETFNDLLWTFPYRHEDFRLKDLAETPHNERVTVEGRIESVPVALFLGKNKSRLQVQMLVGRHLIKVVFFNQLYLKNKMIPGSIATVTGSGTAAVKSLMAPKLLLGRKWIMLTLSQFIA